MIHIEIITSTHSLEVAKLQLHIHSWLQQGQYISNTVTKETLQNPGCIERWL
jgi:hypothetical protein